jgi:hypothetical protein
MPVPPKITELVKRFEDNYASYKSTQYEEKQLQNDFTNDFFASLGWDMANTRGWAENVKEVILEDRVRFGEATKKPDYCFRIGGTSAFYVETKQPSVNIRDDPKPAFQLRNYGWHGKLPVCILTDFDEFAVYDCRVQPRPNDGPAVARTLFMSFREYESRWDEVVALFSHDAVARGALERYASESGKRRGTASVDEAFLKDIEHWRSELARVIALRNPTLTQREMNFTVQTTIDRIVFLRICEDRGIEPRNRMMALLNGEKVYPRLCEVFHRADERYNSGLFHFQTEKGRLEAPDELTLALQIDDAVLKEILASLYPPKSPYDFSILPIDILGQVYERFLGKVIRLTAGHQAKVEEKPEVKKAGGVYYTPTYIVEYIVKNTVDKLLDGKTPKQTSVLRILDPACGSGSFLLGAYQHLLDWHLAYYSTHDPETWAKGKIPRICQVIWADDGPPAVSSATPVWRLTTDERKRILLNNIFGVDIDAQAVEVTKLSLLLKVLEGESQESITKQYELFHQRALPDLGSNIKCGNSLIGPDLYAQPDLPTLTDDERMHINVFDWNSEFADVMKVGGFNAVIGNPPYGFHQIHTDNVKSYFKLHYASSGGSFEHYFIFYEASLNKLCKEGLHGFIVPVTWLTIPSAGSLRKFVLDNFAVQSIAWLPELVFKNAQVNTLVSIIRKAKPSVTQVLISEVNNPSLDQGVKLEVEQAKFVSAGHLIRIFESATQSELLDRIDSCSVPLGSLARPCSGYNPYEVGKGLAPDGRPHTLETIAARPYHSETKQGEEWKPEAVGRDLGRYSLEWPKNRFVKYGPWLAAARDPDNFIGPRLVVQEIAGGNQRRIIAMFCEKELYHSRDIIPVKCDSKWPSPLFLLGIVNSWLITWRHHRRSPKARKALFPKLLVSDLKQIPVPRLSEENSDDKTAHDRMVKLVAEMLLLHCQQTAARTPQEQTGLDRQIAAKDAEIDLCVYGLYGLTQEEVRIVEKPANTPSGEL